ncbi:ABC transporter permease [uncultured Negativibacillus sp.]|uniref:ABC transporter permease n=1 Tax=uncultured Negativibacillus sp. TaxID=1980696 RepID=UPI0025E57600|nr:ABC transporter permease [uncultured Negativibacillus sp.]
MKKFVLKRFLQMFLVWILVSIFSFSIIYFAPGDPLYIYMTPGATGHKMTDEEMGRMRESLGLNGNVVEQYVSWAEKLVHGNLGISINNKQPVLDQILEKLPCTVGLMGSSLLLSLLIAIPLGLIAGTHKNKLVDNIISGLTYLGISVPAFWLGIVLIILFSMKLGLLPSSGMRTIGVNSAWDVIKHGILPAVVLGLNNMAVFVRYIRSNTITQMEEEYVQTAISKGISNRGIMYGQVLKNCMLPIITVVGSRFGTLVTGSFIIESVFAWPGLGTLGMSAINNRDYPMIMGITMFSCTILLLGNFLADILYGFADPRIKQGKEQVDG